MKLIFIATAVLVILPNLIGSHPLNADAAADATQIRAKRSGSGDIFGLIKNGVLSGIGSASASVAGGSSGGSSSAKTFHPPVVEEAKFDGWTFKKSLFNTIFQAVKAITGGVTALKGKLIKGSGYLVSAKGKLIAAGGDAVTNVGKKIALSAKLVPPSGVGHFAKLSGAGSAGPLSAHLSSGSSGSSSSSHAAGPTGHSDGFTSFEAPSGGGHASYGAPAPAAHAAPAPSVTYGLPGISYTVHKQVSAPGYLPPSSHGTSYKAPSNSYGTPSLTYGASFEGPPSGITGYSNTKLESFNEVHTKDTHQTHNFNSYDFSPSSTGSLHSSGYSSGPSYPTKSLANAADALRQILQKIPSPGAAPASTYEFGGGEEFSDVHPGEIKIQNQDDYKIQQYPIPPDPVPAFKPLKSIQKLPEYMYGVPLEISHTQSLTTAYGAPISDFQKPTGLIDVQSHQYLPPVKPYPIPTSALSQNSYNVYHSMSLRRNSPTKTQPAKRTPQQQAYNTISQTLPRNNKPRALVANNKPIATVGITDVDTHVHQQQINQLHKTLGTDFVIEKSIGYEIKNPQPAQIKRSIETTLADQ